LEKLKRLNGSTAQETKKTKGRKEKRKGFSSVQLGQLSKGKKHFNCSSHRKNKEKRRTTQRKKESGRTKSEQCWAFI